mmetsp:Transcript_33994/g.35297  ORF Transcript_33994/g.35297 Transcript_33994/m.35297 type:complete len:114 (-) Transcript_33994:72-413(-)
MKILKVFIIITILYYASSLSIFQSADTKAKRLGEVKKEDKPLSKKTVKPATPVTKPQNQVTKTREEEKEGEEAYLSASGKNLDSQFNKKPSKIGGSGANGFGDDVSGLTSKKQ